PCRTVLYTLSLHDALPISVIVGLSRRSLINSSWVAATSFWLGTVVIIAGSRAGTAGCDCAAANPVDIAASITAAKIVSDKVRFRSEEHTSELQSRGHLVCR